MKILIIFCLFFAFSYANKVPVLAHETIMKLNGKYHYHYELGDGSKASQDGVLKHVNAEYDGEAVEGKYSFIADDGHEYSLSYIADENGYQPVGAHLPTPPPIPESVIKALKYISEHPYHPPVDKKKH